VLGSPRSGVDAVFATLAVGIAERFGTDDLSVLAIDPSAIRRRGLLRLPHCEIVTGPDDETQVAAVMERVAAHLAQPTGPPLLLMIHDVAQVRRTAARARIEHRVEQVLAAATIEGPRVNVVASATDVGAAGPLGPSLGRRLVGAVAAGSDSPLGELEHLLAGAPVGRCVHLPDGDVVQLPIAPRTLEQAVLTRLGDGGARG
jgi:hypothetical protein